MTDSPIHVKLDYVEAKDAKKEVLSSQINLLELKKGLSNYKKLRLDELRKKEKLSQKIKNIKTNIAKLEKTLPKVKKPKFMKKEREEVKVNKNLSPSSLEQELNKIKAKLKRLEE